MSDQNGPEPTFEELVAALLQVDPEGITGQTAGKKPSGDQGSGVTASENDEGPA